MKTNSHTAKVLSTQKVILLIGHGNVESDGPSNRVEIKEVDDVNPERFQPPQGTRAYAFFWEHRITVRTRSGSSTAFCTEPIGSLFTDTAGFPTRETVQCNTDAPAFFGSDPEPYSFLFAELLGRNVYIREMPTQ